MKPFESQNENENENENEPVFDAVDAKILRDLESKYASVQCPVHATPPQFDIAPDGSVIERLCCEALSQILRELEAREEADPTEGVPPLP